MRNAILFAVWFVAGCMGPKDRDPAARVDPGSIARVWVGETALAEEDPFADDRLGPSGEPKFNTYFTIDDPATAQKLVGLVAAMEKRADFGVPAIGILSEQRFLDQNGDIVLRTHIVNWKCCVVLTGGPDADPRYRAEGSSREFCEIIFRQMRERSPEVVKSQRERYRELGLALEGLLFGGDSE